MKRIPEDVRLQMREDRESGMTLGQLLAKYDWPKSTISLTVKGCDTSKVVHAAPGKRVVQRVVPKVRPSLSKTDLGEAARQMICARLMLSGVKVFRPMTEDTPIDLLVLSKDGKVLRCQCKYVYPDKRGAHVLTCHSSGRGTERGIKSHVYGEDEVDFFLGYCSDDDAVYVVPRKVTSGKSSMSLWILRDSCYANEMKGFDAKIYKNAFDLVR